MPSTPPAHTPAFAVEWREGFCIGIDALDREHRQLFSLVMRLNLETVEQTVEQLLDYVVTHFTHEQEAMEASGYPAFEQHLQLHEAFAAQMADFLVSSDSWTEERVQNLRRFLNRWLIGHILTHDMRFGKWLAAKNQPPVAPDKPRTSLIGRLFG